MNMVAKGGGCTGRKTQLYFYLSYAFSIISKYVEQLDKTETGRARRQRLSLEKLR